MRISNIVPESHRLQFLCSQMVEGSFHFAFFSNHGRILPPPFVSRALGHHHSCSRVCANCFILSLCFSHSSINQFLRTRGFDCKCFLMISYLQFFSLKGKKTLKTCPIRFDTFNTVKQVKMEFLYSTRNNSIS